MTERFLSLKEVGERLGVKNPAAKGYNLPEPDALIGATRGWLPETIDRWNAARPAAGSVAADRANIPRSKRKPPVARLRAPGRFCWLGGGYLMPLASCRWKAFCMSLSVKGSPIVMDAFCMNSVYFIQWMLLPSFAIIMTSAYMEMAVDSPGRDGQRQRDASGSTAVMAVHAMMLTQFLDSSS